MTRSDGPGGPGCPDPTDRRAGRLGSGRRDIGHRRSWGRRRWRLPEERAADAMAASLACRPAQDRPRQDKLGLAGPDGELGRDPLGERVEQRVLVLLRRVGSGEPDAGPREVAQRVQPMAARVRSTIAQRCLADRGDARADGCRRGSDEHDDLVRKPVRGHPSVKSLGGRPTAVEPQLRGALDPLPDARQLDGRAGQRSGELDGVDPGPRQRDGTAPLDRSVGQKAHGAYEVGACRGCVLAGHADTGYPRTGGSASAAETQGGEGRASSDSASVPGGRTLRRCVGSSRLPSSPCLLSRSSPGPPESP